METVNKLKITFQIMLAIKLPCQKLKELFTQSKIGTFLMSTVLDIIQTKVDIIPRPNAFGFFGTRTDNFGGVRGCITKNRETF